MSGRIEILDDAAALASAAAQWICETARAREGTFSIALSGGSTPRGLYEMLACPLFSERMPWPRIHWFWSDERFVPHDDPKSNYRMAREALFSRVPIEKGNIHPILTESVSPDAAASLYERTLELFHGADVLDSARPLFDITLLGLGTDGHTASLFPGAATLGEHERWVAADCHSMAEPRITLTYPALESCRHIAFLVAGKDKRDIFNTVRRGDTDLPAARLRPKGDLLWFVDRAAAGS